MTPSGQTETPQLRILLLGPPLVTRNGNVVRINRRELRAGLYYLAGHTAPVSRAEICYTFWPGEPEKVARKRLREGLSRLRTVLNDPDIIIANNDYISLDYSRVYVDAVEYGAIVTPLLNSFEINSSGILPEWMYVQLKRAMALCRGHQFVQDASLHNSTGFDSWVSLADQSFAFSHEKILERLAEHCIALGNIDEAIIWLGKILSFDQLNTDINYLMINCLRERHKFKEAGDYLAFLENYYVSNQMGALPEILTDLGKRLRKEANELKPKKRSNWPVEPIHQSAFVGRNDLLLRLNNAYHRKGLVHISGDAGSGKTRLVQEFYSRLEYTPKLMVCTGRPQINSTPYSPIIEGLNQLLNEKDWQSLPDEIKTNLHSLYPALKFSDKRLSPIIIEQLPDPPITRVQNALFLLFKKIAETKPLLMVVDIAQWCDNATLQFLSYLNDRLFFKQFGLLILISRTEEHNLALDSYLDQSVLTSNLERITVLPFTLEETSQVVGMELGQSVSTELINRIHSQTGGNPFLLIETLRALDLYSFDTSTFTELDHFPVPASVRAVVNEKMRSLSVAAKELVVAAAVLGHRFHYQYLEKMIDVESETILVALEELQQAGIISSFNENQKMPYYEFPHDQFRIVAMEDLSPGRKRKLHLAAVQAMLNVKGKAPDLASTFAWHYEQAGEYDSAFSSWCDAARYSRDCFSKVDAYSAYQGALNLLTDLPVNSSADLIRQLLLEWGDYAYDQYDVITCEKLYKVGLEFGEARQDALIIGISISGLGRVAEMRKEVEEGIELHQRALFFLGKTRAAAEKLETYARLGILYELNNNFKQALQTYLTGLKAKERASDMRYLDASVNLKSQLSLLYSMMGFPHQAENMADQAANESKLITRLSGRVHALTALAVAQYYCGKNKKSMQTAFSVYKLAEHLCLDWWVCLLDIVIARTHLVLGQLDEAWNHIHHAVDNKDSNLLHQILMNHYLIKGDIFRLLGDLDTAEEQYRHGMKAQQADLQSLENMYALGHTLYLRNECVDGLKLVQQAVDMADDLGLESISLPGKIFLESVKSPAVALNYFEHQIAPLVDKLKTRGFATGAVLANLLAGDVALGQDDEDQARQHYIKAADDSNKIGHLWYEIDAIKELTGSRLFTDELLRFTQRKYEIITILRSHATKKPVIELVEKFIKSY